MSYFLQKCREEDPDLTTKFKPRKADKHERDGEREKHRERDRYHERDRYQRERDSEYMPAHSYHEEREKKPKKKRDTFSVATTKQSNEQSIQCDFPNYLFFFYLFIF